VIPSCAPRPPECSIPTSSNQNLLEFPLTELIENRDYPGSSHFFFDIGNDNLLAFFDFPGIDQGPYQEVLGGRTTSR
jgi:hypothetical protein